MSTRLIATDVKLLYLYWAQTETGVHQSVAQNQGYSNDITVDSGQTVVRQKDTVDLCAIIAKFNCIPMESRDVKMAVQWCLVGVVIKGGTGNGEMRNGNGEMGRRNEEKSRDYSPQLHPVSIDIRVPVMKKLKKCKKVGTEKK